MLNLFDSGFNTCRGRVCHTYVVTSSLVYPVSTSYMRCYVSSRTTRRHSSIVASYQTMHSTCSTPRATWKTQRQNSQPCLKSTSFHCVVWSVLVQSERRSTLHVHACTYCVNLYTLRSLMFESVIWLFLLCDVTCLVGVDRQKGWSGVTGQVPTLEQYADALSNHDLFV